ncbi:MAG: DegV family protein [Firmicutes bacterium]|nr:DegV family protein [Bacillota bacterium]
MADIQIVTDSASDLTAEMAKQYGIRIVPLSVTIGDKHYTDGVDLTAEEFYQKLRSTDALPRTSQPAPGRFADVYREAIDAGKQVLSIHIASKLSGTYQAATLAAEMVGSDSIVVVDSETVSMGVGLLAIAAARRSSSLAEAQEAVNRARETLGILFVPDTFEYMVKNGRIGKAASLAGSLLQIKPILTIAGGTVDVVEKLRGRKKARRRLLELFRDGVGENKVNVAVLHADAEEEAQELLQEIQQTVDCAETYFTYVGPVIGSHAGPGVLGLVWHVALP